MPKDASYESVTAVQEKVLEAIKVGHEATLSAVSDATEAYVSSLPDFTVTPNFETLIGFSEELWERQREFNMKMYQALAPVGRSVFAAAKETAKTTKQASEHAKPAAEHARAGAAKA